MQNNLRRHYILLRRVY